MDSLPSNFFDLSTGVQVDILSRLGATELQAVRAAVPAYAAGIDGIINARQHFNTRRASVARVLGFMHRGETVGDSLERIIVREMGLRPRGRALYGAMEELAFHLDQVGRRIPSLTNGRCTATYDEISALDDAFAADFNRALGNIRLP